MWDISHLLGKQIYIIDFLFDLSKYVYLGGSDDWALGGAGIQYSYTIELPPKGSPGFELPPSRILDVGKETYAGVVAMLTKLMNDAVPGK